MTERPDGDQRRSRETEATVNDWLVKADFDIRRGLFDRHLIGTALDPTTNTLDLPDPIEGEQPYPLNQVNFSRKVDLTSLYFSWNEGRKYHQVEITIPDINNPKEKNPMYVLETGRVEKNGKRTFENTVTYNGMTVWLDQTSPRQMIYDGGRLSALPRTVKRHWQEAKNILESVRKAFASAS